MRITPASELEIPLSGNSSSIWRKRTRRGHHPAERRSFLLYRHYSERQPLRSAEGEPLYMVRKDFQRARGESGLKEVMAFSSMKDIPELLAEYGYPAAEKDRPGTGCPAGKLFRTLPQCLPAGGFQRCHSADPQGEDDKIRLRGPDHRGCRLPG